MRIEQLKAARETADHLTDVVRRKGTLTQTQVETLLERRQFRLNVHGAASIAEFVQKFAPDLIVTEGRTGDTYVSARSTSEAKLRKDSAGIERERALAALERLLEEAPNAGVDFPAADSFVHMFEQEVLSILGGGATADLFSKGLSKRERRFVGAACVRLLHCGRKVIDAHESFRIDAVKLLDDVFPDLYRTLGIDTGDQTYEKLSALASVAPETDTYLLTAFQNYRSADPRAARQRVMQALNSQRVKSLLLPFISNQHFPHEAVSFLASAHDYLEAAPASKLSRYEGFKESLATFKKATESDTTQLGKRLSTELATEVAACVDRDYESSPLSKPADLRATPTEKRYPLGESGAVLALSFAVRNEAEGHALDARLSVEIDETRVEVSETERYLGELKPGEVVGGIEFNGSVLTGSKDPLTAILYTAWRNGDGSEGLSEHIVDLSSQQQDVDWNRLRFKDPYSLEPVTSEDELVGRSELLDRLESKARAANVGSFWLFGQKRVGKTSLAKAFDSRLKSAEDQEFITVYLEAGDYVDPVPEETIKRLGRRLCKELSKAHPTLAKLDPPEFQSALAPLTDYLGEAADLLPDTKFIFILDEFDELPIELFRRGGLGDAFFLTLRSISGKPHFGFLLVGGERMEFIMSAKGDSLNKFASVRVDYFDRETSWEDFQELLLRPIEGSGISISEEGISANHAASAGNPYFAKLIGAELFAELVRRRDGDARRKEMEAAVARAVQDAGVHRFQHFWEDGIFEVSGELKEDRSVRRRQVLLAFAEVVRSSREPTQANIAEAAAGTGLSSSTVAEELKDFERRQILVRNDRGEFDIKVSLFRRWLIEYGVRDIVTSLTDKQALVDRKARDEEARVKPEEIVEVAERFRFYRGREVTTDRIRTWLNQFETPEEQRLMFQVLKQMRYYDDALVREKLRNGHEGIVLPELARRGVVRKEKTGARKSHDNILISHIGAAGKSGPSYVRLYWNSNGIFVERAVDPEKLPNAIVDQEDVRAIVVVDDFIGTGRQAAGDLEPLLRGIAAAASGQEAIVIYLCVSGWAQAAERLERKVNTPGRPLTLVRIIDPLDSADLLFSGQSRAFADEAERVRAEEIASRYGASIQKRQPLGYGGLGVAIAFEYSCPNTTLPILWCEKRKWMPLFPRH